jgi:hypothetical protein
MKTIWGLTTIMQHNFGPFTLSDIWKLPKGTPYY